MRKFVLAAATTALLAACGSETSGEFTTADGETGEYTMKAEGEGMTATVETEDGTATMRSGPDAKPNLPKGFTLYPGANVVTTANVNQNGQTGSMTMFETGDSPEKVANFYRKQAEKAGFKIQTDANVNGSQTFAGEGPDGSTFMVNANASGDKTLGQLVIGKDNAN